MEKLKMQTPNLVDENIQNIGNMFPNVITEIKDENGNVKKAIDFDLLKQQLSDVLVEDENERYRLDWPGKKASLLKANTPINKTLRPVVEESVDFDTTENLYIEGDNFEVLKILQESYLGKVKMIYIDPPYNTGNDFIYKDNFKISKDEYEEELGIENEEGEKLFKNTDTNGRFHSDWLSMIYERLVVARDLLREDGVIFVSIDEIEKPNIRKICDELFGEENFIADIVWAAGKKNDSRFISISHEYIICYVKQIDILRTNNITWRQKKKGLEEIYKQYNKLKKEHINDYSRITQEMKDWYKNLPDRHPSKAHKHYSHADSRGLFFPENISWPGGGGPKYEILHPKTKKPVKIPSRGWMTGDQKKFQNWIDNDLVYFGEDETKVPCMKSYLINREKETPYSIFYQDGRAASKRLRDLMNGNIFPFPKDENILQEILEMITNKNDLILDFFSGSATTAHAVMQLNAEDSGERKFIMVQLPEKTDENSEAYKAGYKTISDIGKERIRRAGKKILDELNEKNKQLQLGENNEERKLDIGFRVYKVDSSNMKDVYYHPTELSQDNLLNLESNIKEDRSPEDLLTQVILDLGLELNLPIEKKKIQKNNVFFVQENSLVACFEDKIDFTIIDEIAKIKPLKVVFKDASFKDDKDRINVEERFKRLSPETSILVL